MIAIPRGARPTAIGPWTTERVLVSITETELPDASTTQAYLPSGVIATSTGSPPTGIVPITALFEELMTETVPSPELAT